MARSQEEFHLKTLTDLFGYYAASALSALHRHFRGLRRGIERRSLQFQIIVLTGDLSCLLYAEWALE
ncbi:MAG: hypothetical protein AAFQ78_03585 [Bacteroidota bacterium]